MDAPDASRDLGARDRALLELLYAGGLRVSELAGLDLRDVALETMEVRVRGKGGKQRVVLMGAAARDAVAHYVRDVRPGLVRSPKAGGALFLNRYGARLSVRSIPGEGAPLRRERRASRRRAHPHAAPLVRHAHVGRRRRPPRGPGASGALQSGDDPDIHPRQRVAGEAGVFGRPPQGRTARRGTVRPARDRRRAGPGARLGLVAGTTGGSGVRYLRETLAGALRYAPVKHRHDYLAYQIGNGRVPSGFFPIMFP